MSDEGAEFRFWLLPDSNEADSNEEMAAIARGLVEAFQRIEDLEKKNKDLEQQLTTLMKERRDLFKEVEEDFMEYMRRRI